MIDFQSLIENETPAEILAFFASSDKGLNFPVGRTPVSE